MQGCDAPSHPQRERRFGHRLTVDLHHDAVAPSEMGAHALQPHMSDEYQIPIPPSFQALYLDKRGRLTERLAVFRERYELCEDMAQMLVERSQAVHHDMGVEHEQILARTHAGLATVESGFTEAEAAWVVTRLAELLGWEAPALDA